MVHITNVSNGTYFCTSVDTVEGIGTTQGLVYCRASTSHHTAKTGFQTLEDGAVEVNIFGDFEFPVTIIEVLSKWHCRFV